MIDLDCEILYYVDEENKGWKNDNCRYHFGLENKLWHYYHSLGVNAYHANSTDPWNTVEWRLNGVWYNSSQIERIMKLRTFL